MAPPAADIDILTTSTAEVNFGQGIKKANTSRLATPLKNSGSLDQYQSFDVTNVIGREFSELQLSSILNDDAKIRDLAITGQSFDMTLVFALTYFQFLNEVLCSSVTRTSPLRTKRSWDRDWAN